MKSEWVNVHFGLAKYRDTVSKHQIKIYWQQFWDWASQEIHGVNTERREQQSGLET